MTMGRPSAAIYHLRMRNQILEDVLIIGGGTAGWMTAAYLARAFGSNVRIRLVESASIPKATVGETALPNLKNDFFDFLGISESEWMHEASGAFNCAVKYLNWRKTGRKEHHFYHPYGNVPDCDGVPLPQYWFHLT